MPGKRKNAKKKNEFYRTDPKLTRAWLDVWRPKGFEPARILEPAAGDGAMIDPLHERFPAATIEAFDVAPQSDRVGQKSMFFSDYERKVYDLVITNPPFSRAVEFAEEGLTLLAPGGRLVLLLKLQFLASRKRIPFFRRHLPNEVWIISERQSFVVEGTTDWSDHAFYVWKYGRAPKTFRGRHLHY